MGLRHDGHTVIERDFDVFIRSHARPVLAYCLRRAAHADAHDAAAEVFSIAWRRFDDVPEGDAARYWLLAAARRVLSNQRRAQRRRRRLMQRIGSLAQTPLPAPEIVVVRSAQDREVIRALQSMSEKDREILFLIVWDELPRPEVSALLGISEEAVHKRYQRALQRLERLLNGRNASRATVRVVTEEEGAA